MEKPIFCSDEILSKDLSKLTFIVTGSTSGIGLEVVKQIARQSANIVMACKNFTLANRIKEEIIESSNNKNIEVIELNLSSLDSIKLFVKKFLSSYDELHGLINNAGIYSKSYQKTLNGYESNFGVNHLGPFLLTYLLLDVLKKTNMSRIINTSSALHLKSNLNFQDFNFENYKFNSLLAYANSKMANLLHAKYLAIYLKNFNITSVSLHPGWICSGINKDLIYKFLMKTILKPYYHFRGVITPWEGAQTTLHSLISNDVLKHNGEYFSQSGAYLRKEDRKGGWPIKSPHYTANDKKLAEDLWNLSLKLVL
jgi:NAD(P)-dependent dehydrogenase (short-subunit alcohol dehydrogenase family)